MLSRLGGTGGCCEDVKGPAVAGAGAGDRGAGAGARFGVRGTSSTVAPSNAPLPSRFNGDKLLRCDSCGAPPRCDGCGCCFSVAELPCDGSGSEPVLVDAKPMRAVGVRILSLTVRLPLPKATPRFNRVLPSGDDGLGEGSGILPVAELCEGPAQLPEPAAAAAELVFCMRRARAASALQRPRTVAG